MRKQLTAAPVRHEIQVGATLLYQGEPHLIVPGKRVGRVGQNISAPPNSAGSHLQAFLRVEARNFIAPLVDQYAARVNRTVNRLTLRDTRSRWGSCTADGNLMFSWRLVMAPPHVLEYVVAHEVAHLVEMNHSAAFWKLVEDLMPDYDAHRKWLRANGAKLHAYDFMS